MAKVLLVGCLLIAVCGCAKLEVTKITPSQRALGCADCVKGMRYYMSRPYVSIKRPILVVSTSELYLAHPDGTPVDDELNGQSQPSLKLQRKIGNGSRPGGANAQDAGGRTADTSSRSSETASRSSAVRADAAQDSAPGGDSNETNVVSEVSGGIGTAGVPLKPQAPPEASAEGNQPVDVSADIEIIYLPDFDEQYAMQGRNCFSKQTYGVRFEEGWKLTGVNVETDSTPTPIEFLNLINKAIQAARNLGVTSIDPNASPLPLTGVSDAANIAAEVTHQNADKEGLVLYEFVTETHIKPGIYRINKPWETGGMTNVETGLLGQLGLPTIVRTYRRVARQGSSLDATLSDVTGAPPAAAGR